MAPGNISEWVTDSPLKGIFLICGVGMGIFYGFDGWRGSTKAVSLKESPRVKNFIYVCTVAFAGFIGDLRKIDEHADKPPLLLLYLIGFVLAAGAVVGGWGLLIFVNACWSKGRFGDDYLTSPFSQLSNYLYYGFQYHREALEKHEEEARKDRRQFVETFLPKYIEQLSYSLAAVNSPRAQSDPEVKKIVGRQILQSIRAVVLQYYGDAAGLEVNCNYMLAHVAPSAPAELRARVLVPLGDAGRYSHFLSLEEYALDIGRENFALPVPKREDPQALSILLPGAPTAFFTNSRELVDDTEKVVFSAGLGKETIDKIKAYFKRKSFKSFACLNIARGGKQIGVLNIESNQKWVFGETQAEKDEVERFLLPFSLLLGYILD
jgi:hypothetical protein